MVQMSAMLWGTGIFFAILGFLRGWNREVIATAGIVLAAFALFQFDTLLRGWLLANASMDQVFLVEISAFLAVVFFAYRLNRSIGDDEPRPAQGARGLLNSLLGALAGFFNGYLVWGVIWYFLDVSQYPFAPLITAPSDASPSAGSLNLIPLVLVAGGTEGSGEVFALVVLVLFFLALVTL